MFGGTEVPVLTLFIQAAFLGWAVWQLSILKETSNG